MSRIVTGWHLCELHKQNVFHFFTNSGLGAPGPNWDLICVLRTNVVYMSLIFLHRVNNKERHIKQNIYTGMEAISLLPP